MNLAEHRAGEKVSTHAIVLGSVLYKESDRIVSLMTADYGKISAYARSAARSRKRFGGSLESFNHVKAHLRAPREGQKSAEDAPLWILEETELQTSFPHIRRSMGRMEAAFFVVRLLQDFLPNGHAEKTLFQALGRFLRDLEALQKESNLAWARLAFWSLLSHDLGYGDLVGPWHETLAKSSAVWNEAWALFLETAEFLPIFRLWEANPPPAFTQQDEFRLYQKWVSSTGLNWNFYEKTIHKLNSAQLR